MKSKKNSKLTELTNEQIESLKKWNIPRRTIDALCIICIYIHHVVAKPQSG